MSNFNFDYSEYEDAVKKMKSACAEYDSVISKYSLVMRMATLIGIKEGETADAINEYIDYVDVLKDRLDVLCGQVRKNLKEMKEQIDREDRYR